MSNKDRIFEMWLKDPVNAREKAPEWHERIRRRVKLNTILSWISVWSNYDPTGRVRPYSGTDGFPRVSRGRVHEIITAQKKVNAAKRRSGVGGARPKPATSHHQQEHFTGPRGEPDAFGNGSNTQAHAISLAMRRRGQSVEEIAARAGVTYVPRIQAHLAFLKQRGLVERRNGRWALTNRGLAVWRQKSKAATTLAQSSGRSRALLTSTRPVIITADDADETDENGYEPDSKDRREVVERQIRERRGQAGFRQKLRRRYGDRCLISGCEIPAVLEAAHICGYRGPEDNKPANGLLLRADLHTLFDLDLLGIEPKTLAVKLHPAVAKEYEPFADLQLRCTGARRPSQNALKVRYKAFRQRLLVRA